MTTTIEDAAVSARELLGNAEEIDVDAAQENGEVFVFPRLPKTIDDQALVVYKATGAASLVVWPAAGPPPFFDLVDVYPSDED